MTDLELMKKDLGTFSDSDLNILYKKYKVDNLDDLSASLLKLYHMTLSSNKRSELTNFSMKKSNLPGGDIFDAIYDNNEIDFMEFVSDSSFNINQIGYGGNTPLIYAIECNFDEAVGELLKRNPDLNIQNNDGETALMISIRTIGLYDPSIVKTLIEKGANPNLQDSVGDYTTLMHYIYGDFNTDIFKLMVDKMISTNVPGQTPNIDIQDSEGNTALIYGIKEGRYTAKVLEGVRILVEKGANVNIQNNKGETALIAATEKKVFLSHTNDFTPNLPIIKILLAGKADPNIKDSGGHTALMYAGGDYDTIETLIKAGADPNIQDSEGNTVLDYNQDVVAQVYLLKFMAVGVDISKYKKLIRLKILEIRKELEKYKSKLDNLELDQLNESCNETETGDIVELENITRCVKTAKTIKKYRPGKGKALQIEKSYHKKLATREKGTK